MERSVLEGDLHRVHRVAGEGSVGHGRLESLLDRRDELLGNVAALDLVDERKTHLAVLGGTDLEDDVGELTATAGLLLEDFAVLNRLGERLLVVDLRSALVDLDAELAAQTVDDDVEVQLTHTADDRLTRILVGVHREGGVLLGEFRQRDAEFVEVLLGLGLHGQTDHRLGEGHLFQNDRSVLGAERIARADLLETYGCADVTGTDGFQRVLLVGVHLVDTADALALAAAGVEHVRSGIELARVNADEGQTTYEGVGSDLERQAAEGIVLRSVAHLLLLGFGVDTRHGRNIQRRGQERHHVVEQFLHALVVERRAAEHRDDLHRDRGLADGGQQFVGRDRVGILEELLHQGVVRSGDLLDEFGAPLGGLGLHRLGNIAQLEVVADGLVVVVVDRIIIYKVYQSFELVLGADRKDDRQGRSAEVLLDLGAHREEVGTRAVHLVDVADTGDVVLVGLTPYGLRLGLDAADGAERGDRTVQNAQRTLHLDRKVDVSRGIDQVDLVLMVLVLPEGGRCGRGDGDTALLLLDHPVHGGAALMHLADLVGFTRVEKDSLGRRGLTGIDVGHDTDITRIM